MLANSLKPVSCRLRPSAIESLIFALLVTWFANLGYRNHFADARDLVN